MCALTGKLVDWFEALQNSLNGDCLLTENNEHQFGAQSSQGMYSGTEGNNFAFACGFCTMLTKVQTAAQTGPPTLPIYLFEQKPVLVVPPLAHIHTVRSIQLRHVWRPLLQKFFVLYSSHRLTLLGLGLQALLVHTPAFPLRRNDLPALPFPLNIYTDLLAIPVCIAIGRWPWWGRGAGCGRGRTPFLARGRRVAREMGLADIPQLTEEGFLQERHVCCERDRIFWVSQGEKGKGKGSKKD